MSLNVFLSKIFSKHRALLNINKARLVISSCKYISCNTLSRSVLLNQISRASSQRQHLAIRCYSSATNKNTFYYIANETLESLTEKFDRLVDEHPNMFPDDYDVTYSNNVLTVKLDAKKGTYVINTQTPNQQIWLSSPKSGPYRFDFTADKWVYKHTGETLHELLSRELSALYSTTIDFTKCTYGAGKKN